MYAIINSRLKATLTKVGQYVLPLTLTLAGFACVFCFILTPSAQALLSVPVKPIALIAINEEGDGITYPTAVFFDPVMEETYVVNGGKGTVVVYGPDYFPRIAIDSGRGVFSPQGITVLENGDVYLTQVQTYQNPSPKITILNGAFFIKKEIFLDQIEEASDFRPKNVVVNQNGLIYLSGDDERGVLVLDDDGNFLRRLQPMDEISKLSRFTESDVQLLEGSGLLVSEESITTESGEVEPEEDLYADIPEEFRPRIRTEDESFKDRIVDGLAPVKINYISTDSSGKLYLVSAETGSVYVYGPNEDFLFSFGKPGGSPGQLSQPRSLAVDEKNQLIYIVDYMRHTILAYNLSGTFVFELGGRGSSMGFFNFPMAIAINGSGEVIVTDVYNKRVQVLEVLYRDARPFATDDKNEGKISDETGVGLDKTLGDGFEIEAVIEQSSETKSTPSPEEDIKREDSGTADQQAPGGDIQSGLEASVLSNSEDETVEEVIMREDLPASFSAPTGEPGDELPLPTNDNN